MWRDYYVERTAQISQYSPVDMTIIQKIQNFYEQFSNLSNADVRRGTLDEILEIVDEQYINYPRGIVR